MPRDRHFGSSAWHPGPPPGDRGTLYILANSLSGRDLGGRSSDTRYLYQQPLTSPTPSSARANFVDRLNGSDAQRPGYVAIRYVVCCRDCLRAGRAVRELAKGPPGHLPLRHPRKEGRPLCGTIMPHKGLSRLAGVSHQVGELREQCLPGHSGPQGERRGDHRGIEGHGRTPDHRPDHGLPRLTAQPRPWGSQRGRAGAAQGLFELGRTIPSKFGRSATGQCSRAFIQRSSAR